MKSLFTLAFAAFATFAASAHAAPITEGVWQLENNTTHRLGAAGFYRYNGTGYDLYDFETNGAEVLLTYDATAGTIDLAGSAYDTVNGRLVDIDLDYTGVTASDDRVATSFLGLVGSFDGVEVMSKANAEGWSLFADSLGSDAALNGHGWIGTDAGHFGDFHFDGARVGDLPNGSVPVPGGLAFLMIAGAGFFVRKRIA